MKIQKGDPYFEFSVAPFYRHSTWSNIFSSSYIFGSVIIYDLMKVELSKTCWQIWLSISSTDDSSSQKSSIPSEISDECPVRPRQTDVKGGYEANDAKNAPILLYDYGMPVMTCDNCNNLWINCHNSSPVEKLIIMFCYRIKDTLA